MTQANEDIQRIGGRWSLHHVGNVYLLTGRGDMCCRTQVEWPPGTSLPGLLEANGRDVQLETPYVELRGLAGSLAGLSRQGKLALLHGLLEFIDASCDGAIYSVVSAAHARAYDRASEAIGWRAVKIAEGLSWGCVCGGTDWPEDVLLKFERSQSR
jgi:hypothetical protein